jgi:DNA-binding MarR family transcriptional regulator
MWNMITPREKEILDVLRKGIRSPTLLATELRITQSGATQALQKLEKKAAVTRMKIGRNVFYSPIEEEASEAPADSEVDIELIMESYHALSKVWSHLLGLNLTQEELAKVRA